MAKAGKSCFVIGPIGKEETPTREWADTIYDWIIVPATTACGYAEDNVHRADQSPDPSMITPYIISNLSDADLVIADLSDANPNVYFELAVRWGSEKKACVYLIKHGQRPLFDIQGIRLIEIDINIKIAEPARDRLKDAIGKAEQLGDKVVTPLSYSLMIKEYGASPEHDRQLLANIMEAQSFIVNQISELKAAVAGFTRREQEVTGSPFTGLLSGMKRGTLPTMFSVKPSTPADVRLPADREDKTEPHWNDDL
jgi:hypothetical protein